MNESVAHPAADMRSAVVHTNKKRQVGLLALQGDYDMHRQAVRTLGHQTAEVRTVSELEGVDCLIMPGGESTTMQKLLAISGLDRALREFAQTRPIMGTCAGLILLAHPAGDTSSPPTLGLLNCTVARNAYGRQYQSFRQVGEVVLRDGPRPFEMVFIRAPRITGVGDGVEVLGRLGDEPTMVRQDNILAMTFHPELSGDGTIHDYFLAEM